ncbi:MAG: sulfatase activating formylglycine-generating enzyme [Cryomorphaceae bacterium]|jgi:formylglycine-generating enzyme required for sulfatase activity
MNSPEQFDNAQIEASEYEAPSGQLARESFELHRGHWLLFAFALLSVSFIIFISLAKSVQVRAITPMLSKPNSFLPQAAEVQIDSRVKLPIGNRVLLLPGQHKVKMTAVGYADLEHSLDIGSDRHQQFELVMTRLPGQLSVSFGSPIDTAAEISIDGQPSVIAPGLVLDIPAGLHQVTVDAPLYRSITQGVLIQGKQQTEQLQVDLEPAWAEYTFSTMPADATLLVDGVAQGETSLSVKLEEGLRSIEFQSKGFKRFKQDIGVVSQQNLVIPEITLIPADGILNLASKPEKAAVILNGEYRGVTPLELKVVPNQSQRIQIYKAGYRLHEQQLALEPDQLEQLELNLVQDLVSVKLSVSPNDAEVLIDGVSRGTGSQNLRLNTLPHRISVRKSGYVAYNTELIPTKRNAQIVSVNLLTYDQHYWAQVPDTYANKLGHQMKLFKPSGEFKMGSSRREAGRRANEVQFTAALRKPFYAGRHETNNKQFRAFKASHNAGNYKKKSLDANKAPAVNISWQQAALYCNWLSEKEGLDPFYQIIKGFISGNNIEANGYRLLTEAEWAWLARIDGDETLIYPWGNTPRPTSAKPVENLADVNAQELIAFTLADYDDGFKGSAPIGRFTANHNGLYDMGGNASEWVNDWYSAKGSREMKRAGTINDPIGPDIGEFHVVRGASWAKGHLPQLRLAYRDYAAKGKHDIGFRVARYAGRSKGKQVTQAGSD